MAIRRPWRHPAWRSYRSAVLLGLVLEAGLLASLVTWQNTSTYPPLLFLAIALLLGWRYGAGPGIFGSIAPIVLYVVAEAVRRLAGIGGEPEESFGSVLAILTYVAMLLAFIAGMTGVLRARYFPRRAL